MKIAIYCISLIFLCNCSKLYDTHDLTLCGNGIIETGEECDDGNTDNDDNCLVTCQKPRCGDGIVQTSNSFNSIQEECDPPHSINQYGYLCTYECQYKRCSDGNFYIASHTYPPEQCDGVDNDCDGVIEEFLPNNTLDCDSDNITAQQGDCNDFDDRCSTAISFEFDCLDGVDNDCNTNIDMDDEFCINHPGWQTAWPVQQGTHIQSLNIDVTHDTVPEFLISPTTVNTNNISAMVDPRTGTIPFTLACSQSSHDLQQTVIIPTVDSHLILISLLCSDNSNTYIETYKIAHSVVTIIDSFILENTQGTLQTIKDYNADGIDDLLFLEACTAISVNENIACMSMITAPNPYTSSSMHISSQFCHPDIAFHCTATFENIHRDTYTLLIKDTDHAEDAITDSECWYLWDGTSFIPQLLHKQQVIHETTDSNLKTYFSSVFTDPHENLYYVSATQYYNSLQITVTDTQSQNTRMKTFVTQPHSLLTPFYINNRLKGILFTSTTYDNNNVYLFDILNNSCILVASYSQQTSLISMQAQYTSNRFFILAEQESATVTTIDLYTIDTQLQSHLQWHTNLDKNPIQDIQLAENILVALQNSPTTKSTSVIWYDYTHNQSITWNFDSSAHVVMDANILLGLRLEEQLHVSQQQKHLFILNPFFLLP